jgi:tetratricopeptide (TPR) repeat protein
VKRQNWYRNCIRSHFGIFMKQLFLLLFVVVLATAGITACTKSPEVRTQQALERGKKRFEAKDYARAVLEFKNATQASPQSAEAQYQLGVALLATGDLWGGYTALRKATELDAGHAGAQVKIAELHTIANKPELLKDAAERMQTLLASKPSDSEALSALAHTELRLGEANKAEEHLARAVENGPANLRAAVGLARLRLAHGKTVEAEQILLRVAEQKPPTPMAYIVLGEFYLRTNRLPDAKREFEKAVQIDSGNVAALLYLSNLHFQEGRNPEGESILKRISTLPDHRYRAIHAVYLFEKGKREDALKELEQLVAADASDIPTRRRLVATYLQLERTPDAERVLAKVLKTNEKDTDALMQRSIISLASSNITEAYNDLTQVVSFEPSSAEARYLLARVHAARGNMGSAKQELAEAVRLNPEPLRPRLEYARVLLTLHSADSALVVLDAAPEWHKRNPAFVAERNWTLAVLGRKAEMRAGVEAALKAGRTAELLLQSAVLKMDSGDMEGGRAAAEEVLKQSPEDMRALDLLTRSYVAYGQTAAAVRRLRSHALAYPKSAVLQHHLGVWLIQNGSIAEARSAFQAAKAADASFWRADLALAEIDLAENNVGEVRQRLQPLLSHVEAKTEARIALASVEHKAGNRAGVIEHYRKAIAAQPDNVTVLNNLAYALSEDTESRREALKFAQRAKELAPENATVDDTIGWILYRNGMYAQAVQHLENAVKREANAARHAHLALAYAARGDKDRGRVQLQAAMKLDPALPEIAAAKSALSVTR